MVYAVAARNKDKAEAFAKKHGIEKAYGSYDQLINDPEVDVVYNPVSWICDRMKLKWNLNVFSYPICFTMNGRQRLS